ncbi:pectin lyase fold/virulence factor [Cercophora scortea]|uniref:Pectin lyase fold/virulence factor n=1 Tax=Cercophora scortea TaxID=314031 RepID=A0AAE0I2N8_9PEZI|nr:pectin lyase fold/virulence factor [Cercophora scortea]
MMGLSPFTCLVALLYTAGQWSPVRAGWQYSNPQNYPLVPESGPSPGPAYMVDNTHNYYHVAPDKGKSNGPVWPYSGSLDKYMANLADKTVIRGGYANQSGTRTTQFNGPDTVSASAASGYWLASLASLGAQPLAGGNSYQFYRDVTDFGADNTGKTDATEAINAAVSSWSKAAPNLIGGLNNTRCGKTCGNTFTQGAIVYFPPGTYKICKPVIQLYYTQFIGDAKKPPTIKGCSTFEGIALFDTDPYIPGGSGSQWYINQNQFFRQIRNFVFDLTDMPLSTAENDQPLVPTGIHWQVAQATSLQNLVFNMPKSSSTTAVGIFTENGSGGFVSDLTFNGGSIGWRVGSQQFTARNLKFNNCLTAVQMIWDWGFTWQGIEINGGAVGFNITGTGGPTGQGTGSVSLVDCSINDVPVGILTSKNAATAPNIVLDNTVFKNVAKIVQADGGNTLLSKNSNLWASGKRYNGSVGTTQTGDVIAPGKAKSLLDKNGNLFVRSRPQYEALGTDSFLIATKDGGCKNDGTGDQTLCINAFLLKAVGAKKIAYFPAGIYTVGGTVVIPTNSQVQGSSWSQIQGSGYYFGDLQHPQVVVQVGNKGDVGTMEIVEMLFSVKGNTAGAILMEWNTAAVTQGAAAMWDSHFRVGGGKGTDLDLATCPKLSFNDNCIASTLMFHVTAQASGYFENVWAWVADHDNDASIYDQPDSSITQISIFGARGMLIESQGPSWFYGGGSEHSVLYNYLLSGAKSVYMGHIQTESPYFQPVPAAPVPFDAAPSFANDPDFSQCNVTADSISELCRYAWGLRVIDSTDVTIHSAGLYSFFNEYYQDCVDTHNCQERILEVKGSTGVVIYNLFTVATVNIATGIDGSQILRSDSNQRGFTTEVSVWLPLPGRDHDNIVYVGPDVFTNPTMSCSAPCVLVFPTSHLETPTTITPSSYTTSFEYGTMATATRNGAPTAVFVTTTTTLVISIPPITVSGMPYSNFNITSKGPTPITIYPSVSVPPVTLNLPDGKGGTTSRVIPLPPWPLVDQGPDATNIVTDPGVEPSQTTNPGGLGSSTTYHTGLFSTVVVNGPKITTITFPPTVAAATFSCPATTEIVFATPSVTVRTSCTNSGLFTINFGCPTTKVVSFLASTTASVQVGCTLITQWSTGQAGSSTETPLPTWSNWPLYGSIVPVTTSVSKPQPTDNGVVVPCAVWFFVFCISWGNIHIGAWVWSLPPGIYPPGPPPIGLIRFPSGFNIEGKLPPWPRITIGQDKQLTTDKQPDCETKTAQACTTTTFFSATATKNGATSTTLTSTSKHCETISGCSIRGSDASATTTNVQFGTQTIAPVGSWPSEAWPAADMGEAYSSSVFAALSAALAADDASASGTVISFTPGPAASPTCTSGTGCGGRLCSGFWCVPSPTGHPPAYQDPKDPSSGGFVAPISTIGQTTTPPTSVKATSTSPPPPPPPTSTSPKPSPTFNQPPEFTLCDDAHRCDAWTCPPDGHTPYCLPAGSGPSGPLTSYCGCTQQFKLMANGSSEAVGIL